MAKTNEKAAESIADPSEYENLFPELSQTLQAEKMLAHERKTLKPASLYPESKSAAERNIMEELSDFLSRTSVTTTDSNGVLNADVTQTTSPTLAKPSTIKNEKDDLDLNFDDDDDFQLDTAGADVDLDNDFNEEDLLGD